MLLYDDFKYHMFGIFMHVALTSVLMIVVADEHSISSQSGSELSGSSSDLPDNDGSENEEQDYLQETAAE